MFASRTQLGAVALLSLMAASALLGGCATESVSNGNTSSESAALVAGAPDELVRPPKDFTLDVAILTGSRVSERADAHLRPGHFILLADGSLLHDSGRSVIWDQRPGRTRTLYQQQVADLWALARQLGFTSPGNSDFSGNPGLLVPDRTETIYILAFAAGGERWTFVRGFAGDDPPDPASAQLIRALAELAWSSDLPSDRFIPVRYDFGPDPYSGFRRRS